jgi:DNA repair protein RecO (recombination protein O)
MRDNQVATRGIVLSRTDYNEADRIVTFLTPDEGKVRAIAKGVRRGRSKLAGGVELFSVSELTFLQGKSDLQTLVSARLVVFYGNIIKDLERTQWAYDVLKTINRLTEAAAGPEFFELLQNTLAALDNSKLAMPIVEIWFDMQLLRALGNEPNLTTDKEGEKLASGKEYSFDLDAMTFFDKADGGFTADYIKLLRLALTQPPEVLQQIKNINNLLSPTLHLVQTIRQNTLRI